MARTFVWLLLQLQHTKQTPAGQLASYAAPQSPLGQKKQLFGEVHEDASLPMCKVSLLPQVLPQVPTGLPFSLQLTNHLFAQVPFVPVLVVVHAPFGPL